MLSALGRAAFTVLKPFMTGAEVLDALRATAVETLTPIEALNLLYQLKQKL